MLEAGLWGLVAASSLLIGAAAAAWLKPSDRWVALLLGLGAGALISALAFELTEEAFALGGADTVAAGLGAGALAYYAGSRVIGAGSDRALLLGATLDGILEAAVLGITVLEGEVSAALLAAVFISNLPESEGTRAPPVHYWPLHRAGLRGHVPAHHPQLTRLSCPLHPGAEQGRTASPRRPG